MLYSFLYVWYIIKYFFKRNKTKVQIVHVKNIIRTLRSLVALILWFKAIFMLIYWGGVGVTHHNPDHALGLWMSLV